MKYTYQIGRQIYTVEIEKDGAGYRAVLNGQEYPVQVVRGEDGALTFTLGDHLQTAYWAKDGPRRWVFVDGKTFVITSATPGARERHAVEHTGEDTIRAPMPGHVRAVQVAEGDAVSKGQTLFVLEAMKMEIRVQSPRSGKLARIAVTTGQPVEREQVLAEIK
ncbi:MAG: biotin/lipoyl-containing protein [Acidobacteriota bacterium]